MGIIKVGAEGTMPAHRRHVEKPEVATLLPRAPWKNGELIHGVLQGPSCSQDIFAKGKLRHTAARCPTPWGFGGARVCHDTSQIHKEGKPYKTGKVKAAKAAAWEEAMLLWQASYPPASVMFFPPGSHQGLFLSWEKEILPPAHPWQLTDTSGVETGPEESTSGAWAPSHCQNLSF